MFNIVSSMTLNTDPTHNLNVAKEVLKAHVVMIGNTATPTIRFE